MRDGRQAKGQCPTALPSPMLAGTVVVNVVCARGSVLQSSRYVFTFLSLFRLSGSFTQKAGIAPLWRAQADRLSVLPARQSLPRR